MTRERHDTIMSQRVRKPGEKMKPLQDREQFFTLFEIFNDEEREACSSGLIEASALFLGCH